MDRVGLPGAAQWVQDSTCLVSSRKVNRCPFEKLSALEMKTDSSLDGGGLWGPCAGGLHLGFCLCRPHAASHSHLRGVGESHPLPLKFLCCSKVLPSDRVCLFSASSRQCVCRKLNCVSIGLQSFSLCTFAPETGHGGLKAQAQKAPQMASPGRCCAWAWVRAMEASYRQQSRPLRPAVPEELGDYSAARILFCVWLRGPEPLAPALRHDLASLTGLE